jgi:hypothetical protein
MEVAALPQQIVNCQIEMIQDIAAALQQMR